MVTVAEPQYDPRFSTQAALNRTVVSNWIRERAMNVLDEWFAKGFPHKRLATEAMECAVREGWIDGVEKIWASGWVAKGPLLRAGWNQQGSFRRGPRPAGVQDTPMEAWLIDKTWGPTGDDKEWDRGQAAARIVALLNAHAHKDPVAWDRYLDLGVSLASAAGQELLNTLLTRRFPYVVEHNYRLPDGDERAQLDRRIDQLLSLPDAQRAPLRPFRIEELLAGVDNLQWDAPTQQAIWSILQQLLSQSKPGLDATDLGMTVCRVALVGRHHQVPQERLDEVLNALLRWGAPASMTLTEKDLDYAGRYHFIVSEYGGHVFVPEYGSYRRGVSADHTDAISLTSPTVHVGDHWFATLTPPSQAWGRAQVDPLTEAQKQDYRARFEALVEAAELQATTNPLQGRRPARRKTVR